MQERNLDHLTQIYDNKVYYAEPEKASISCKGCVFLDEAAERDGVDHCKVPADAEEQFKEDCYHEQIIWKEKPVIVVKKTKQDEPKFTVEQVLLAAGDYLRRAPIYEDYDKIYPEALAFITEDLVKGDDPDYQLYLQLKYKYEQQV